jgi:hypothetical protein
MSALSVENCVGIIRTERYDILGKQCKFHCGENVSRWGSCKLLVLGGTSGVAINLRFVRTCSKFKPPLLYTYARALKAWENQCRKSQVDRRFAFRVKSEALWGRSVTGSELNANIPTRGKSRAALLALNCVRAALKIAFLMFEGRAARFQRRNEAARASFSRRPDKIHSQPERASEWAECMHPAAAFVCPLITAHFDKAPLY